MVTIQKLAVQIAHTENVKTWSVVDQVALCVSAHSWVLLQRCEQVFSVQQDDENEHKGDVENYDRAIEVDSAEFMVACSR